MTLPVDWSHGLSRKQSEKPAHLLVRLVRRLDDAIVAVAHAFWRAVVDGFATHGMSVCAPTSDLDPRRTIARRFEEEGKPVMHSWSEFYNDDCVFEGYDDIDALILSLRLWEDGPQRQL